jgi:hypothetical protein
MERYGWAGVLSRKAISKVLSMREGIKAIVAGAMEGLKKRSLRDYTISIANGRAINK